MAHEGRAAGDGARDFTEQIASDQQGDRALARIEDQGGDGQILAPGAQDVGRTDIARADVAHVACARGAGQDDAERN
ncbi:hypothetical protein D3C85_1740870 [compost metagenome]